MICEKTMFPLNLYLRVNNNRFKTDQFVKYSMEVWGVSYVTSTKIIQPNAEIRPHNVSQTLARPIRGVNESICCHCRLFSSVSCVIVTVNLCSIWTTWLKHECIIPFLAESDDTCDMHHDEFGEVWVCVCAMQEEMQVRKLFAENTVPVHITACLFMYLPFKNSLRSLSCASKVFARAAQSIFH